MKSISWVGIALSAATAISAGCAGMNDEAETAVEVDEDKIARLPANERSALINDERAVTTAEANENVAKVAKQDAERYADITAREEKAAKEKYEASREAVELARGSDQTALRDAEKNLELSHALLAETIAKRAHADAVSKLRDAELDKAEAAIGLARAEHELKEGEALARHGMAKPVDVTRLRNARDDAAGRVAEHETKRMQLQRSADEAKTAWDSSLRAVEEAQRAEQDAPAIEAPRPAKPVQSPREQLAPAQQAD